MKIHMKVGVNIESTVKFGNFPSKLAVKFALNFTASCQKAVFKVVTLMFAGHIASNFPQYFTLKTC